MAMDVIAGIRRILAPILEREGLLLYDVEFIKSGGRSRLCIYIDREGGVNHGHCQAVSGQLSAQLEVEDIIRGAYTLEVSSPGLTRKLKKEEHFIKSEGLLVNVTFKKEFGGPQKILGTLHLLEGGRFRVIPKQGAAYSGGIDFSFDDVAKARLEIE